MKRILYSFCGYAVLRVPLTARKKVMNLWAANGILLLWELEAGENCDLCISVRNTKKAERVLTEAEIPLIACKRRGLPAFLSRYKHRAGLHAGLFVFFLLLLLAPRFIWEIRIVGAENLRHAEITAILSENGIYLGAYIPNIDRDGVYASVLQSRKDISWLSVNFRGSVATVEIIERNAASIVAESVGVNIVAKKDGRITDMQITRGSRAVQNGAIVKKGDLLVSGVYDTARFGTRFVHAKATILAEVSDTYTVTVPLTEEQIVYGEEILISTQLNFFDNSINIFKKNNKLNIEYDIITKKESLPLPLLERLPLYLTRIVALPYTRMELPLAAEDALMRAKKEAERLITDAAYKDLLSLEECFSVEENQLIYTCQVYAVQDIAASSAFTAE